MRKLCLSMSAVLAALCVIAATPQEASAGYFWHHGYCPCDYGRYSAGYQYYYDADADYHYYEARPIYNSGLRIIYPPGRRYAKIRWVRPHRD